MYQRSKDPVHELIAVRAYELWENQGRPHGRDVVNWHQAEQDIISSLEAGSTPDTKRSVVLPDRSAPGMIPR